MVLISIIIIAMFIVLIAWSWNSLGTLENKTKIICITVGVFVAYIFTLIIFKISKIGINYPNIENMKLVQNVFVMLFTAINEKVIKSIIILAIIIILVAIFEVIYLGNSQTRILDMMKEG